MNRRLTHTVQIDSVRIGSDAPIVIQSMTNTNTADAQSTANQVKALADAGSELVRITVNTTDAASAVPEIRQRLDDMGCYVPLIGDFHFNGDRLLKEFPDCAKALAKYRINPGNVAKGVNGDDKFAFMIHTACENNKEVRIGVNWGSLDQTVAKRLMDENKKSGSLKTPNEIMREALIVSALESAQKAIELGQPENKIILSCKVSHVQDLIAVYRDLASRCRFPLHLGLTEAGMGSKGIVASTAALAVSLQEGIGDTIRISITGEAQEEVLAAKRLLHDCGLYENYPTFISCPTCGRTQVDCRPLGLKVLRYLEENNIKLTVAIMGCVVNGPGESKHADIGVAGGKNEYVIFKKGQIIKKVSEQEVYDTLINEINSLL